MFKKNDLHHIKTAPPFVFVFAKKSLLVSSASAVLSSSFGSGAILDCLATNESPSVFSTLSPKVEIVAGAEARGLHRRKKDLCVLEVLVKKT